MAEGWKVTGQAQRKGFDPGTGPVTLWDITFRTDHGVVSSVTVPDADYTPDKVHAAIQAQADKISAVHSL